MKLLLTEEKNKKVLSVRLICLVLAMVMLLASCGEDASSSSSKKEQTSSKAEASQAEDTSSDEETEDDNSSSTENLSSSESSNNTESESDKTASSKPQEEDDDDITDDYVDDSNRTSSVPKEYTKLVWSEEFEGTALNKNTWEIRSNYYESQYDCHCGEEPELLKVEDGCLTMAVRRWFDPYDPTKVYACPPSLATNISMNYRYGYLEMLAKVPFKTSSWPALWTGQSPKYQDLKEECGYGVEVDVFEIFGTTNSVVPNIHKWFTTNWQKSHDNFSHAQTDIKSVYNFQDERNLSNEWHVYGYEWTDTYMAMYVDGVEYNRFDLNYNFDGMSGSEGFHIPSYVLLSNAVYSPGKSDGPRTPDEKDFPGEFIIDYLRLYQNPNQANNLIDLTANS